MAMVDERVGWAGLGISVLMNAGAMVYATRLVSRVEAVRGEGEGGSLRVYTHSLPFGRPGIGPKKVVRVGGARVELSEREMKDPAKERGALVAGNGYQPFRESSSSKWSLSYLLDTDNSVMPAGERAAYEAMVKGAKGWRKAAAMQDAGAAGEIINNASSKRKRWNPRNDSRRHRKGK